MFGKLFHRVHGYVKRARLLSRGVHALGYGRSRRRYHGRGGRRMAMHTYMAPSSRFSMASLPKLSLKRGAALGLGAAGLYGARHYGGPALVGAHHLGKLGYTLAKGAYRHFRPA